ncbi:MAG TPA: glycoside hydrolase family 20 zincin-like fold domain-containing protein [Lentimicrobium sp.]|nr:glycoside hydrolase family 20 zincin-like fold domain-containing protein [Lentimicrobium sp.]
MKNRFWLISRFVVFVFVANLHLIALSQDNLTHSVNLIPQPKNIIPGTGFFQTGHALKVYISKKATNETRFTLEELKKETWKYGIQVKTTSHIRSADIIFCITGRDKAIVKEVSAGMNQIPVNGKDEGYFLKVDNKKIIVAAATEAGLFYGMQTLKQLIRTNKENKLAVHSNVAVQAIELPALTIIDWPSLKYRGWMDDISRGPIPTVAFLKNCIQKMAEYKQNYFTLYTEHVFKLKNYPDIAPADGLTVEEINELTEFAAKYHIEMIGNFQSFGHMAKILSNPFYTSLGENADILNPADESTYTFLKNVYAEIIPSYKSTFFNINCDETFGLGEGKSKKLAAEIGLDGIYASHINRIDQLIKPYGKRIMMWGDIAVNNPGIINKLPKDLIILSWGYHAAESFDDAILPFKKTGFDFMVAPGVSCWNEVWPGMSNAVINISNYVRDGYKLGAMGMMNTAWDDNGHNLFNSNWHGLIWGAECSWNPLPEAHPEEAVYQRNTKLKEFNHSFDKLFFKRDGITETLMAIDSLRLNVPGILNEWSFWSDILDFNSTNTTDNFIDQNKDIIARTHLLSGKISVFLSQNPENQEMIDNAQLALQRIAFTAEKNITRAFLYKLKATSDNELIDEAKSSINNLKEQLYDIKKRYIDLWERENRTWWLDKNLNDYNALWMKLDDAGRRVFVETSPELIEGQISITMKSLFDKGPIVYTLDGTEPSFNSRVFDDTLRLSASALIKARVIKNGLAGPISEKFICYHKGIGCLKSLHSSYSTYNPLYAAGGSNGLVDGLKGSVRFNDGRWQGYQGQDLDIEFDLKTVTDINSVSVDFIQSSYSWILLPRDVEILVSDNGTDYRSLKTITHNLPMISNESFIHTFTANFQTVKTRYIRLIAHNPGVLPPEHHAAGNPSFIFADEVIIK